MVLVVMGNSLLVWCPPVPHAVPSPISMTPFLPLLLANAQSIFAGVEFGLPGMEPRRADSQLQGEPTFWEPLRLRVPRLGTPAWGHPRPASPPRTRGLGPAWAQGRGRRSRVCVPAAQGALLRGPWLQPRRNGDGAGGLPSVGSRPPRSSAASAAPA